MEKELIELFILLLFLSSLVCIRIIVKSNFSLFHAKCYLLDRTTCFCILVHGFATYLAYNLKNIYPLSASKVILGCSKNE